MVSFVGGIFSGLLGGGAGCIRMPAMVYLLGVPTHAAVGTDLFEVVISASYGTFTHAFKGNVDIMIALVMDTGAAIGTQIGATAGIFSRTKNKTGLCSVAVDKSGDCKFTVCFQAAV